MCSSCTLPLFYMQCNSFPCPPFISCSPFAEWMIEGCRRVIVLHRWRQRLNHTEVANKWCLKQWKQISVPLPLSFIYQLFVYLLMQIEVPTGVPIVWFTNFWYIIKICRTHSPTSQLMDVPQAQSSISSHVLCFVSCNIMLLGGDLYGGIIKCRLVCTVVWMHKYERTWTR